MARQRRTRTEQIRRCLLSPAYLDSISRVSSEENGVWMLARKEKRNYL